VRRIRRVPGAGVHRGRGNHDFCPATLGRPVGFSSEEELDDEVDRQDRRDRVSRQGDGRVVREYDGRDDSAKVARIFVRVRDLGEYEQRAVGDLGRCREAHHGSGSFGDDAERPRARASSCVRVVVTRVRQSRLGRRGGFVRSDLDRTVEREGVPRLLAGMDVPSGVREEQ